MPTKRPDKVVTGSKDNRSIQILKGPKDVRQVRCTNKLCGALISASPDGKGGVRHKCHQCGTLVTSTRI